MNELEQRLKISVQKNGRLSQPSQQLLRDSGLRFAGSNGGDRLVSLVENFPAAVFFDRDDDIPVGVEAGDSDLGIVGQDMVVESGAKVFELTTLGFGMCRLVVAAPEPFTSLEQLKERRVVTSYPNAAATYFCTRGIPVALTRRSGSVEGYTRRGYDAIVDITDSGKTLIDLKLRELGQLLTSEAVLIASPLLRENRGTQRVVEKFLWRITSALRARDYRYILLNAPSSAADDMIRVLPSSESPTISDLKKPGWLAIASVVPVAQIYELGATLQQLGAKDIVIQPMNNMLPNPNDRDIMRMMEKIYD